MCKTLLTETLLLKMRICCTQTFEVDLQKMGCQFLKLFLLVLPQCLRLKVACNKDPSFITGVRNATGGAMCRRQTSSTLLEACNVRLQCRVRCYVAMKICKA